MSTVLAALDRRCSPETVLQTAAAVAALLNGSVTSLELVDDVVGGRRRDHAETAAEAGRSPADQVVRAAQDPDVAMLVVPARSRQGQPHPSGRTPLDAISQVAAPVVVVPADARPPERIRRVLVPLEEDAPQSVALEEALKLIDERELEVLALHVLSPERMPAFSDHEPHGTEVWDEEFLSRQLRLPHERITLVRRLGRPAREIAAAAREADADLVILAWHQNLSPGRAEVVRETLANATVPVLLIATEPVDGSDKSPDAG